MVIVLQTTQKRLGNSGKGGKRRLRQRPCLEEVKCGASAWPNTICFSHGTNNQLLRKILMVMVITYSCESSAFLFHHPLLICNSFCRRKKLGSMPDLQYSRRSRSCIAFSVSVSTSDVALQKPFHQYTVKELRELIRDTVALTNSTDERPIVWSQFKRKQDYIDFLLSHQPPEEEIIQERPVRVTPSSAPLPRMPPASSSYTSPKDIVFELVYQRYPPLRPSSLVGGGAIAPPMQPDVRQEYHPVMRHLARIHGSAPSLEEKVGGEASSASPVQADMDIVCVGTASCTPGTTRGVSCTAVRMNFNRRGTHEQEGSSTSTFQSGTWLFDVGECTQVRCRCWYFSVTIRTHAKEETEDAGTRLNFIILNDNHLFQLFRCVATIFGIAFYFLQTISPRLRHCRRF
jgi:hypothetical protein